MGLSSMLIFLRGGPPTGSACTCHEPSGASSLRQCLSRTSHNSATPLHGHPGVRIIYSPCVPSSSFDTIDPTPPSLEDALLDDHVLSPAASPSVLPLSASTPVMTSLLHLPGRPLTLSEFPSPSLDTRSHSPNFLEHKCSKNCILRFRTKISIW